MQATGTSRRVAWLLGGLLVLGGLWIYRDTLAFGFTGLDDDYNVVFNPHLGPLAWRRVAWAFTDGEYSRRYQPLGWLGFAGVFSFSGLAPAGYNAALVALHGLNALLAFAVLRVFTRRELGADAGARREVAAFLGAAFWAWHPLRVESAAWTSGLLYGQMTAFTLAALWLQLRERRGAAVGFYALALLTYPAALGALPLFVLPEAARDGWRAALRRNLGHVVVALAAAVVNSLGRFQVVGTWPAVPTLAEFPLWQRAVQALYVWAHYLWRPWWPLDLSPVDPVLLHPAHPPVLVLGGAGLVVALAGWLAASRHARGPAGWFFLAHVAVLVPVLGFWEKPHFPSDRYAGLAQLVPAAALALLVARAVRGRAWLAPACAVGIVLCAVLARRQTEIWRDEPTLWRHVTSRLAVTDSPVLACARPALAEFRAGHPAAALGLAAVARLAPDYFARVTRRAPAPSAR